MPYAYGATIEHEFDTDHLNIWLTFRHPMDQTAKPEHDLWTLTADDVEKAISDSAWQDEFTLLLVSDAVTTYPDRVLLAYDGPDENLRTTWDKQWEPWEDSLSDDIGKGKGFVDRGDPSEWDFELGDFTTDNAWHDLDLSAIVPAGAKAVLFFTYIVANVAGAGLHFKKKGTTNEYNRSSSSTQVANLALTRDMISACDADRKIQYKASNVTWSYISVSVRGWWF